MYCGQPIEDLFMRDASTEMRTVGASLVELAEMEAVEHVEAQATAAAEPKAAVAADDVLGHEACASLADGTEIIDVETICHMLERGAVVDIWMAHSKAWSIGALLRVSRHEISWMLYAFHRGSIAPYTLCMSLTLTTRVKSQKQKWCICCLCFLCDLLLSPLGISGPAAALGASVLFKVWIVCAHHTPPDVFCTVAGHGARNRTLGNQIRNSRFKYRVHLSLAQ